MNHLLFHLGEEQFAIAAKDIRAVLPLPHLEPLAGAPNYVAGLLRFRGVLLPVVDLMQLRGRGPSQRLMSTRVVLLKCEPPHQLAILAEKALEMIELEVATDLPPSIVGEARSWLVPRVYHGSMGLVEVVDWRSLLTEELLMLVGQGA